MSAGADIVITELILLSVICFILVRYYAAPTVTIDVLVAVYTVYILGFAGILFLPYDFSVAIVDGEMSPEMLDIWLVIYWSTFFFAWVVMPILMDFHGSGYFTFKSKLLDAVYRLLRTWAIFLALGISYIIYMTSTSGGSFTEIIGFVMAMGNTYGAFLITFLMGYGLVSVPKQLWLMADNDRELMNLYIAAPYVEEAYQDARYELEDCEVEVRKLVDMTERAGLDSAIHREVGMYIAILEQKVNSFQFEQRSRTRRNFTLSSSTASTSKSVTSTVNGKSRTSSPSASEQQVDEQLTSMAYLVRLHQRLMIAQLKARACERRWRTLVTECDRCQTLSSGGDLMHSFGEWCPMPTDASTDTHNNNSIGFSFCNCFSRCNSDWQRLFVSYTNSLYFIWRTRCFSHTCRLAAVLCGLGSLLILWCEMVMSANMDSPIGVMMTAYSYQNASPVMVQAVSFMALAYMSICTYSPLFRINIGFSFKLQGPQQSPPSSLIFNGKFLSRLQFALGYNFLYSINVPRTQLTAFKQIMRHINIIPLFGTNFSTYVPLTMIVIALLTFFDSFERVVKFLGIEMEESVAMYGAVWCCGKYDTAGMNPEMQEKIKTGKILVANEIKHRLASHPSSSTVDSDAAGTSGNSSSTNLHRKGGSSSSMILQRFTQNNSTDLHDLTARIDDDDDVDVTIGKSTYTEGSDASSAGAGFTVGLSSIQGFARSLFSPYGKLPVQSNHSNHGIISNNGSSSTGIPDSAVGHTAIPQQQHRTTAQPPAADLFALSNDDSSNLYGGRYSDV